MTISRFRISGFKSHNEEVEFPFRRVNILAGPNSSGKSTALQGILLLRQSFDPFMTYAGLKTQGGLVDLGRAASVLSRAGETRTLSIGVRYEDSYGASAEYKFSAELSADTRHLLLEEFEFSSSRFCRSPVLEVAQDGYVSSDAQVVLRLNGLYVSEELHRTRGVFPDELRSRTTARFDDEIADLFSSFVESLPKSGDANRAVAVQAVKAAALRDWRVFRAHLSHLGLPSSSSAQGEDFSELVSSLREKNAVHPDVLESIVRVLSEQRFELEACDLLERMLDSAGKTEILEYMPADRGLARSYNEGLSAYSRSIRYVGPVREQPQNVYPNKGVYREEEIQHDGGGLVPILFYGWTDESTLRSPNGNPGTVGDIIQEWYRFLGIAQHIIVEEIADLGVCLRVRIREESHDSGRGDSVRNVGVGVTQVLPIVGHLALMRKGDTLLIEQPELHLHPSVALRLGQLIAAAGRDNLQSIVETHSEHFVNGVRLGVADGVVSPNDVFVGFFDEEQTADSAARIRHVKIDGSGFIDSWPSGFFDEAEEVSVRLLRRRLESR